MTPLRFFLFIAAVLLCSAPASAKLVQCVTDKGMTYITDDGCQPGEKSVPMAAPNDDDYFIPHEYKAENARYTGRVYYVVEGLTDEIDCYQMCDRDYACKVASHFSKDTEHAWKNSCVLMQTLGKRELYVMGIRSWVKDPFADEAPIQEKIEETEEAEELVGPPEPVDEKKAKKIRRHNKWKKQQLFEL